MVSSNRPQGPLLEDVAVIVSGVMVKRLKVAGTLFPKLAQLLRRSTRIELLLYRGRFQL